MVCGTRICSRYITELSNNEILMLFEQLKRVVGGVIARMLVGCCLSVSAAASLLYLNVAVMMMLYRGTVLVSSCDQ